MTAQARPVSRGEAGKVVYQSEVTVKRTVETQQSSISTTLRPGVLTQGYAVESVATVQGIASAGLASEDFLGSRHGNAFFAESGFSPRAELEEVGPSKVFMHSSEILEDWLTESQLTQLGSLFGEFPQDSKGCVRRELVLQILAGGEWWVDVGDGPESLGLGDFVELLVKRVLFRATLRRVRSGDSVRAVNPTQLCLIFGDDFMADEERESDMDHNEFLQRLRGSGNQDAIEAFRFAFQQLADRLIVELIHARGKLGGALEGSAEDVVGARVQSLTTPTTRARSELAADTEAAVVASFDPFSPMLRSIINQAPTPASTRPTTCDNRTSDERESELQAPLFYRQFSTGKYKYEKEPPTDFYTQFQKAVQSQRSVTLQSRCIHNLVSSRRALKRDQVFVETFFDRIPYLRYAGRTPNVNIEAGPITMAFEHFAGYLDSSRTVGMNPTFEQIAHSKKNMSLVECFLFSEHFRIVKEGLMTKAEISLLFRVVNTKCRLADEYSNDLNKEEFTEILTRIAIVLFTRPPLAAKDHKNWSICRMVVAFLEYFRLDDSSWVKKHLVKAKNESDMIRQERQFLRKGGGISSISVFRITQRVEHLKRPASCRRYGRPMSTQSSRRLLTPNRSRKPSKVRLLDPLRGENSPRVPPVGMQNNPQRNFRNKWWTPCNRKSSRLMRRALSEPNLEMTISTMRRDRNNQSSVLPGVKNLPDTALCDLHPRHMSPITAQHWATPVEDWQKFRGPFLDCGKLFYPGVPYKYHLHVSNACSTMVHLRINCRLPFLRLRYRRNPTGLAPGMSRRIFLSMTMDDIVPHGEYFDYIEVEVLDCRRQPMQHIRIPVYANVFEEPDALEKGDLYIPKLDCLPKPCPVKQWNTAPGTKNEKLRPNAAQRPQTSMGFTRPGRRQPRRSGRPGTSLSRMSHMTW